MTTHIRRVALIEPLGDTGIGTYTYELAEALVAVGIETDVYTADRATTVSWPKRHGIYPVLGSAMLRQRSQLAASVWRSQPVSAASGTFAYEVPLPPRPRRFGRLLQSPKLRDTYISLELVAWLRLSGYDLVWTQWPHVGESLVSFWRTARLAGLPVVHTAHNVFPHEQSDGDYEEFRKVYDNVRLIVTHSEMASRSLREAFPSAAAKIATSRIGLYTTYPQRPGAREAMRRELNVPPESSIVLAYGSVRPYKNNETLLLAMVADTCKRFTLVIAGHEYGYPGVDPNDRLGLTRQRVAELGLSDRVRLLPGPADNERTGDLFEAADVVALPYTESYGSGVLLLAMSLGKCIVASRTGGMDEHLDGYRDRVMIEPNVNATQLLDALKVAGDTARARTDSSPRPPELEWPNVVRKLLPDLERVARRRSHSARAALLPISGL